MIENQGSPLKKIYRIGAGRELINPLEPVWLGGFGFRNAPSNGIISDLYARALLLEDGVGERSLILSIDHLGFGRPLVEDVARRIATNFGIKRENFVIAFSHTHSAPVCDQSLQTIYPMGYAQKEAVERYRAWLLQKLEQVVGQALATLEPVRLFFGQSVAGFGVNRRRIRPGCSHFPAPVDQDVPVLKIITMEGAVKALVFGYACHATTLKLDKTSADYVGYAAENLEQTYPESVCLFVAGCGADINPLPRGRVDLAIKYGDILSAAVQEVVARDDLVEIITPIKATREEPHLGFERLPEHAELVACSQSGSSPQRRWAEYWMDKTNRGESAPTFCLYPIQIWQFGHELTWIFLTGEVCVDYSIRLKAMLNDASVWVSGYTNELVGYIPSERLLQEGGYEGGDSKIVFNLPAAFMPGVEETILDCIKRRVAPVSTSKPC